MPATAFLEFDALAATVVALSATCRSGRDNLLMVADSEHDANMLYAVKMFLPDPFIYLRLNGKCHVVVSDLEIDRVRKQAPHCRVLSLSRAFKQLRKDGFKKPTLAHAVRLVLQRERLK